MEKDKNDKIQNGILPFEAAMDKAGFGPYGCLLTALAGFANISFSCVTYSSMFIIPTSACELETTVGQQGLLAAGPVAATLVGGITWGYLADTRGRRQMLLVAFAGAITLNVIASISVNWIMLLILQFLATIFASGIYSMSMTLLSESVPLAKRNQVIMMVMSIFLLVTGIMAMIALPIIPLRFSYYLPSLGIYWNSWRTLLLVYSVPSIISAACIFLVHESPKFVFVRGDEERALRILKSIHRFGRSRSNGELEVKGLLKDEELAADGPTAVKDQIVPIFKAPLLKYTLIMISLFLSQQVTSFMIWLPTIIDQFFRVVQAGESSDLTVCRVLSMQPEDDPDATPCALDETSLLMTLGISVVLSIVNLFISFIVVYVGRRNMAIVVIFVSGVSGILVNLVPNVIGSAVLFLFMTMGVLNDGLYTAMGLALFPTHLRAIALEFVMLGAHVGNIVSVQVTNWLLNTNCEAGFYLFCSIFLASAIAVFFVPDDRKVKDQDPDLDNEKKSEVS